MKKCLIIFALINLIFVNISCDESKKQENIKDVKNVARSDWFETACQNADNIDVNLYKLDNPKILEDTTKLILKHSIKSRNKINEFSDLVSSTKNYGYCCCPKTHYKIYFFNKNKLIETYNVDTMTYEDRALFFDQNYQTSYIIPLNSWRKYLSN